MNMAYRLVTAAMFVIATADLNPARAILVSLEFSGTFDAGMTTVFGQTGSVPFSFTIVYDAMPAYEVAFVASGATLDGRTTTHEWHGYSAAGIQPTGTQLTFGTKTWPINSIMPRTPDGILFADLWFDQDIATDAPTLSWIQFADSGDILRLGGITATSMPNEIFLDQFSRVIDQAAGTSATSSTTTITYSVVPEARAWLMLGAASVGVVFRWLLQQRRGTAVGGTRPEYNYYFWPRFRKSIRHGRNYSELL